MVVIQTFSRGRQKKNMKFAVFFVFATFAFVAQANAKVIDRSAADRGAIVDALKSKLADAKKKLDGFLEKASDALKGKIAELAKQAELIINQLKLKATQVSDEVYENAQKILEKVGYYEDIVVKEAEKIVNEGKKN